MPALVAPHTHQLAAADGTLLHVSDYLLPGSSGPSIVLMHGLGEHSGRYRQLAHFFNHLGLSVRCYDHRGHGRSQGARGDVPNGDPMLQDAQIVIEHFAARFTRPPFLFGHSMGGLFAARFALSGVTPLRGLVLSSPALSVGLSALQRRLQRFLLSVAPRLAVPNGLQPDYLSHDEAVVRAYKADPLVHGKISARLLQSMLESIVYCQQHAVTLAMPVLLQVAGDDRLVDAAGSHAFFAKLPSGRATLKLYEGFFHEIFNEVDAARPRGDLQHWLSTQLT
ncbi:alpha/beta hydrolase [Massilia sp. CF038]|uniref:alpha/beta hydrolase n=1 Tax=Massilia sp. CF038 TaxID=1881045 RepID=UPI000921BFC5|nr:alpha/beta hydrolase [Massilia sp. CF038]SHH30488.1 Lysophospholipase, alpha-beta hydrolase superfamily [Massilia sp. CF038]